MNNQEKLIRDTKINNLKRYLSFADDEFRKSDINECDKFLRLALIITDEILNL